MTNDTYSQPQLNQLAGDIKQWAQELGFQQCGVTDVDLGHHEDALKDWLSKGYHGSMNYMADHGNKRSRPAELLPGALRVISVRMDYWPEQKGKAQARLEQDQSAYVSRYAVGRDYHKLMRKRLAQLGKRIQEEIAESAYRVFVDSAPVLERALAQKAGLGWIGKNTMLINPKAGSYFFLGELFTDLPLPIDAPYPKYHCGSCSACLDLCPTKAFVAPHILDARRCISYLTIELKGDIPEELRPMMGNRIFGCDDCQMVCPWNKFSRLTGEKDFSPRHRLDSAELLELFEWTEEQFLNNTEGSAIRRTGHESWLRNIAVALGNAPTTPTIIAALKGKLSHPSVIVQEHVRWALARHGEPLAETTERQETDKSSVR
ncbi:iron-sulfur cluster binding protein, putative [Hahella chejuensis KCTC 2396]|uniref:Epoxyqueuosine reductase n=1 Tax=Hahella chejuensis (strain KCTC 2396) TaxID=349521 RepID=Q2SBB5_HAHCH|nr:tRNA epoxyqueuosine(34) reductase QueG [Hahella chejuensis]ABC32059.1 iron-sulfur cluster binding protein, putative [Hahella chejuensis KCTC 2396]